MAVRPPAPPPRPVLLAGCAEAVAYFAPGFAGRRREVLRVAHLDGRRRLVAAGIYPGARAMVEIPFRRIFADALALGTEAMILAHNHPGGDPAPSAADLDLTRALADVARPLGIRLLDHLIFARGGWRSLRAMGLL